MFAINLIIKNKLFLNFLIKFLYFFNFLKII